MPLHELAALGAAACWAMSGILAPGPVAHLGALAFNLWRQVFAALLFSAIVLASGTWREFGADTVVPLVLSGLVGIFVGDSLLFTAVGRLGPRRSGVLFALNAPIAALLGWTILGETFDPAAIAGVGLTVAGVALAILYGRGRSLHDLETVKGSLAVGVAAGIGAAIGQAVGSLIARPVMAAGFDPFAASLLRVAVSAAGLSLLMRLHLAGARQARPLTPRVAAVTALTAFLGVGVGMTLLLYALAGGKVGIVSTLSATSPVLILPLLWLRTGERPAAAAWAGAALVVLGMALIFLS